MMFLINYMFHRDFKYNKNDFDHLKCTLKSNVLQTIGPNL